MLNQCKEQRTGEKYLEEQQSIKIYVIVTLLSECQSYITFDTTFLLKLEKYPSVGVDFVSLFP